MVFEAPSTVSCLSLEGVMLKAWLVLCKKDSDTEFLRVVIPRIQGALTITLSDKISVDTDFSLDSPDIIQIRETSVLESLVSDAFALIHAQEKVQAWLQFLRRLEAKEINDKITSF